MKPFLIRIAKVLLKLALDETLRRGLPKIYAELDAEMPKALANGAPPKMIENQIVHAIAKASGGKVSPGAVELVTMLYDPIKAAIRNK